MEAAPARRRHTRKSVGWLAVALVCVAGPLTAGAHDFWLEPETVAVGKGEELVLHLRMGDQFKTEEERPLQKDRVARFDLFSDRTRRRDLLAAGQEGQMPAARLRPETGEALAVMDRTPRPITMEHDKFKIATWKTRGRMESSRCARGWARPIRRARRSTPDI